MCYNCGCHESKDNHGMMGAITEDTFRKAAAESGQSVEKTKKKTMEHLKAELKTSRIE